MCDCNCCVVVEVVCVSGCLHCAHHVRCVDCVVVLVCLLLVVCFACGFVCVVGVLRV